MGYKVKLKEKKRKAVILEMMRLDEQSMRSSPDELPQMTEYQKKLVDLANEEGCKFRPIEEEVNFHNAHTFDSDEEYHEVKCGFLKVSEAQRELMEKKRKLKYPEKYQGMDVKQASKASPCSGSGSTSTSGFPDNDNGHQL